MDRHRRRGGGRTRQGRDVLGQADEYRQAERVDIGAGALVTAGRIDHDDGAARGQYTQQCRHMRGLIAQHDADSNICRQRADAPCDRRDLCPGHPLVIELDRARSRIQVEHVEDAL